MKRKLIIVVILLSIISPAFGNETSTENEPNTKNLVQNQKEYPRKPAQGNFNGNSKEQTGNIVNRANNYTSTKYHKQYTRVPLKKYNYSYLPQNRLDHSYRDITTKNLYNRFNYSTFVSRPQSIFNNKYSNQEYLYERPLQRLNRNCYYNQNRIYPYGYNSGNRIVQRYNSVIIIK